MLQRFALFALATVLISSGTKLSAGSIIAVDKTPTAEQVAETVIYVYGTRPGLQQVRRNGIERGRITRTNEEGRAEEGTYERRFVRGEDTSKDKVRLDRKTPATEYALVYGSGRVWGVINNTPFTPRQEATTDFLAQLHHDIDALLRYKENGATLTFINKDKQKNVDLWVLDLVDKEKRQTRYYISALRGRVLWLEYEEPSINGGTPVKYRKTFHDYRAAQSTLVPFRTTLYADGKSLQETNVLTITYGVKMEDSLFQNPEAAAALP